jgi:hypothetical protein
MQISHDGKSCLLVASSRSHIILFRLNEKFEEIIAKQLLEIALWAFVSINSRLDLRMFECPWDENF